MTNSIQIPTATFNDSVGPFPKMQKHKVYITNNKFAIFFIGLPPKLLPVLER